MAIAQKILAQPMLIGTSNTTLFANPASQTSYIAGIYLFSSHSAAVTVTLWDGVSPSSGAVGTPTLAYQTKFTLASKAGLAWRIPQTNVYGVTNRALIASATVNNVVTATVCGFIEAPAGSQLTYPRLTEPILLASGTGASTSIIFQNPTAQKTFITGFSICNTHSAIVDVELWHSVAPSSGSPGTPTLAQQFYGRTLAAGEIEDFYYPGHLCYEDLARSMRGRASVANVVNIRVAGGVYV